MYLMDLSTPVHQAQVFVFQKGDKSEDISVALQDTFRGAPHLVVHLVKSCLSHPSCGMTDIQQRKSMVQVGMTCCGDLH